LIGITGIDGTGRLAVDLSGSAEWLMIPYSKAAPDDDTLYDVGGRLSYSVGGINFSVPLLPDTITEFNTKRWCHWLISKISTNDFE
jgi:hypothetical protein